MARKSFPAIAPEAIGTFDVMTVVMSTQGLLGKQFDANGQKITNGQLFEGLACQYHVPDVDDMVELLVGVSQLPNAALINARFPAIPLNEDFILVSKGRLAARLNVPKNQISPGCHPYIYNGQQYRALTREKINTVASSWQLLDRDIDSHTPAKLANLSHADWLQKMEAIFPGLSRAEMVSVPSSSSRVMLNGQPISPMNVHTWVHIQDALDVERCKIAIRAQAIKHGLAWTKPKMSKTNPDQIVGQGVTCILDDSTWSAGRLVFDGCPTVVAPYTIVPLVPQVHTGQRLDTYKVRVPQNANLQHGLKQLGVNQQIRKQGTSLVFEAHDLQLDTELELEAHGLMSVQDALPLLASNGKLRCQAPFRESTSYAAFMSASGEGRPFVHDTGTGTNHWLSNQDWVAIQQSEPDQTAPRTALRKSSLKEGIAPHFNPKILSPEAFEVELAKTLPSARTTHAGRRL